MSTLKKDVSKTGKTKEQLAQEAKELEKEEQEAEQAAKEGADMEATAVESSRPKKKTKVKVSLYDLTEELPEVEMKAPSRPKGSTASSYVSPALKWHQEACHVTTLWFHLHFFIGECALRGDINVDYNAIAEEDAKRNEKNAEASAEKALAEVKKNANLTAAAMQTILKKYADASAGEEMYVTLFVRRAFICLGLLNSTEFCPEGSQQPQLCKAQAKNVVSSLKSWMLEFEHRKMLFSVMRVAEQLAEAKSIGKLKKLIKGPLFISQEKERLCKMVDLVTQTQGIERKDTRKPKGKSNKR